MKLYKPPITVLLLIFTLSLNAQIEKSSGIHLNLKAGDEFIYLKNKKESISTRYPEKVISAHSPGLHDTLVYSNRSHFTKMYFKVLNIQNKNCYILNYRAVSVYDEDSDFNQDHTDSRYPGFGTFPRDVVHCFLNDVDYQIEFHPSSGKMKVLNIEDLKKRLNDYLEKRNITDNMYIQDAFSTLLNEDRILYGLDFLEDMATAVGREKQTIKKKNGSIITTIPVQQNSDSTVYSYVVADYPGRINSRSAIKTYTLKGSYTIDNSSGLLQRFNYSSYIGEKELVRTEKLYQKRTDVMEISESIELIYYSGNTKPTWVYGKYKLPGDRRVGLTTSKSILNDDFDYEEFDKDSTGAFAIKLNLKENAVYNLFFFSSFPSVTPDVKLFLKPGDSIYIERDTSNNKFVFSGKGSSDSRLFNKFQTPPNLERLFRIRYPVQRIPDNYENYLLQFRNSIHDMYVQLNAEKNKVSKEFYMLMEDEFESIFGIIKYYDFWKEFYLEYSKNRRPRRDDSILLLPRIPEYTDYKYLEAYNSYLTSYINLRYNIFSFQNTGGFPVTPRGIKEPEFVKLILSGAPFYMNYGNMIVERISEKNSRLNQSIDDYLVEDFLINCNHQASLDFVYDLMDRKAKLLPGSDRPSMNLLDINRNPYDWEKAEGKIIVLMLYGNYSREHYFAEDLYKQYGENKKDVVILRISPGTCFENWEKQNGKYSRLGHQMYYSDGQFKFNEQFVLNGTSRSYRYLIIDKHGKIFRSLGTAQQVKGAIAAAKKQPPPPETPFFETKVGRALPGVLIGIILTLVFYRIVIRQRLKKRELLNRLSSLEHKAIKAQLNPHFLFNCLNTIQNLIEKNRQKEANESLLLFAGIIRRILKFSDKDEISIKEELDTLKVYIELEKIRFDFTSDIEIDPDVDEHNTMMPPLLIQPIVENALIHGLHPKEGKRILTVSVLNHHGSILFRITDNGVGRAFHANGESNGESRGLDLVKSRIALMNKSASNGYSFAIFDETDAQDNPTGTRVDITVPDEH